MCLQENATFIRKLIASSVILKHIEEDLMDQGHNKSNKIINHYKPLKLHMNNIFFSYKTLLIIRHMEYRAILY